MANFDIQIRERQNPSEDYQRPELLKKATEEIEAEVAALGEEDSGDESSSYDSDEDEDEDADLLTAAVDSQIFRTIAAIKAKDPRVYEGSTKFFDEVSQNSKEASTKEPKTKKVTLKDYERKILLENGGFVNEYDEGASGRTHHQEQEDLRNAFKMAPESDDEEGEDFLTKKDKTSEEKEAEESDYRKFLLTQMQNDEPSKKAFEEWSNYKENPDVKPEDAFLMDYVLNRGWVDKKNGKTETLAEDVDKDEADLDDIDRFESKYNFRFEEEGSGTIKTYARNIEGSVRRKESKRVLRRQREKLHKAALKERQLEEMKEQKNKKMREIQAKLKEISDITGIENIDVEADYDPNMYDAQMQNVFDDAYYGGIQEGEENVKPVWDDDIETGLPDDEIMDADYLPGGSKYEDGSQGTEGVVVKEEVKRDAKRKFNDLMEEYYSLNYEDVIGGDLYTRFKYTKTQPDNYGLTAEEILLADDAELNKYISMKALAPYRPQKKQMYDEQSFKKQQKSKKKLLEKHVKKAAKEAKKQTKLLEKEYAEEIAVQEKKDKKKAKHEKSHKKKKVTFNL